MVGIVFAVAFVVFAGVLYLLNRLIKRMRPKEVRLEEKRILSHRFYRVSVRGRAAYLILCLEQALLFYQQDITAWAWMLRRLWSVTDRSEEGWIDPWLDSTVALLPSIVLTDHASEPAAEEIGDVRKLYLQAGAAMIVINTILENAFKMVSEWSAAMLPHDPDALRRIDEVEETMQAFGVPLPPKDMIQLLSGQISASLGDPFDGLRLSCLSRD